MNLINKHRTTKGLIIIISTVSFCIFSYCRVMAMENTTDIFGNQVSKVTNILYGKNISMKKIRYENKTSNKKEEDSKSINNKSKDSSKAGMSTKVTKISVKSKSMIPREAKENTVYKNNNIDNNKKNEVSYAKGNNVSKGEVAANSNNTVATNNEQAALLTLPANGRISSFFGYRKVTLNNGTIEAGMHKGLDIAVPMGTKIAAAMSGEVEFVGVQEGYGNVIILKHPNGLETLYGHCSKIEVNKGEKVNTGNEIGKVGSTGRSTGPHIHFEVRLNGTAVDPLKYLNTKIVQK
ncbi:M23 family metallopeptidase [Clostridium arbusti]|uniref:M23 family metallopeptidase n=1 Tax=Clostridium arbusti TaxID=1137848 RepID=UPI000288CF8D|nr:M23 family metallopeptidase [Clostridium arbusti]